MSIAEWTGLPWWEQRFLIEMQAEDDARDAHIAEWRNKNAERQRRGMQPLPYQPLDAPTTEPVKLRDHIRRQQAAAGGSPFKVVEV